MKVYTVVDFEDRDGFGSLGGVFSTKEKATEIVKKARESHSWYFYDILELEIDNPDYSETITSWMEKI